MGVKIKLFAVAILLTLLFVGMRIDTDKATFYTLEDGRWLVSGREYSFLMDGATKMRKVAKSERVDIFDERSGRIQVIVKSYYKQNITKLETWTYLGDTTDITLFPFTHTIQVINAQGKFLRYEVRDLIYDGSTNYRAESPLNFGRDIKIEWQDGYNYAHVFKSGILRVQYPISSAHETYFVRLFDPPTSDFENLSIQYGGNISELIYDPNWTKVYSELNQTALFTGNYTINFTEYNITAHNLTTYLFNLTNNGTSNITVQLKQEDITVYREWWCVDNQTKQWNITLTYTTLFNLSINESRQINCTLDILNGSQSYTNFTKVTDTIKLTANFTFNASKV